RRQRRHGPTDGTLRRHHLQLTRTEPTPIAARQTGPTGQKPQVRTTLHALYYLHTSTLRVEWKYAARERPPAPPKGARPCRTPAPVSSFAPTAPSLRSPSTRPQDPRSGTCRSSLKPAVSMWSPSTTR